MTGTPDQRPQHPGEPWAGGPVDATSGMRPILPDSGSRAPAEDTPGWSPAAGPLEPTSVQPRPSGHPAPPATTSGGTTPSITGFFSSVKRTGRWEVPEVLQVVGGFAEAVIDLREAVVRSRTVDLKIYGGFSETRVIVPPGVAVDLSGGVSIFADEKATTGEVDPDAYRLRVSHYGAFSTLRIITLAVGEEPKKWWKRLT